MPRCRIAFLWKDPAAARGYRTGVCLHGHTLHSKECLSFLPRQLHRVPGVSRLVQRRSGSVDFARAYWTPPLTPASATQLEQSQIAALGLRPVVSLTDHDDIEAGLSLGVMYDRCENPVSVEWTVPFENSIFHLGIHNLPRRSDRSWMAAMVDYTRSPREAALPPILEALAAIPDLLIVLNHPFWLEEGVDAEAHSRALPLLLSRAGRWLHAFELNGTRGWTENRNTIALAERYGLPVISGGDRHACEPSACVNVTNAADFAGFVGEIRTGLGEVLFLPHYREPMASRILSTAWDILRPYPEYPDREHWSDRIFYCGEDGADRSLHSIWRDRVPWPLERSAWLVELLASPKLRPAVRHLLTRRGEIPL